VKTSARGLETGACLTYVVLYEHIVKKLIRDGIALAYEERGSGLPPMLFVHCWCCDHGYMTPPSSTSVVTIASSLSISAGMVKATSRGRSTPRPDSQMT
jgi:hypothetical protein